MNTAQRQSWLSNEQFIWSNKDKMYMHAWISAIPFSMCRRLINGWYASSPYWFFRAKDCKKKIIRFYLRFYYLHVVKKNLQLHGKRKPENDTHGPIKCTMAWCTAMLNWTCKWVFEGSTQMRFGALRNPVLILRYDIHSVYFGWIQIYKKWSRCSSGRVFETESKAKDIYCWVHTCKTESRWHRNVSLNDTPNLHLKWSNCHYATHG